VGLAKKKRSKLILIKVSEMDSLMEKQPIMNISLEELTEKVHDSEISSIRLVLTEIIRVVNDEQSSAKDLKEIVEKDPPLTAKVLRSANSVFYHHPTAISDIEEAIIWIGFDTAAELALHHKICEIFEEPVGNGNFQRSALWVHSIAVGHCIKLLYRKEYGMKEKIAYPTGLLHTIGIIIEDQFIHEIFEDVLTKMEDDSLNINEAERECLGYDHAQIGAKILGQWNLPKEMVAAINFYIEPLSEESPDRDLVKMLYVADSACQMREIGFQHSPHVDEELFSECLQALGIKKKALDYILDDVEKDIERLRKQGWVI